MNVVLFASTGRAGSTILNELIRRGHRVTAVARNLDKLPKQLSEKVSPVCDDLSSAKRIAELITGADAVISVGAR